jgi:hypothetical protein
MVYFFYLVKKEEELLMNCNVCGTQIPDGAANCPNCGQAVVNMGFSQPQGQTANPQMQAQSVNPQMQGQPVNPQGGYQQPYGQPQGVYQQPYGQSQGGYQQPYGQPQGGYQQPYGQPQGVYQQPYRQPQGAYQQMGNNFNVSGLANLASNGYMKLVSIISALLIYHGPILSWLASGHGKNRYAMNLFELGKKGYLDSAALILFGIIFLIVGAVIVLMELADYIPALGKIKSAIPSCELVQTALVAVALIVWFLAFFNGDLLDATDMSSVNHGVGPIFTMIGIVANAFVRACNILAGKR